MNYMTFNASKCKFMLVSRKRQHIHPNPSICLNGSPLELTPTFKYLGLLISFDLSWSGHIDKICSRAKRIWGYYTGTSTGNQMSKHYVSFISPLSGRIYSTLLRCGLPICTKTSICLKGHNSLRAKCALKSGTLAIMNFWKGFIYRYWHNIGCI